LIVNSILYFSYWSSRLLIRRFSILNSSIFIILSGRFHSINHFNLNVICFYFFIDFSINLFNSIWISDKYFWDCLELLIVWLTVFLDISRVLLIFSSNFFVDFICKFTDRILSLFNADELSLSVRRHSVLTIRSKIKEHSNSNHHENKHVHRNDCLCRWFPHGIEQWLLNHFFVDNCVCSKLWAAAGYIAFFRISF